MVQLNFLKMNNHKIEKAVTKSVLRHCIDIDEKNEIWSAIDIEQLKKQEKERLRYTKGNWKGLGKAEEVKVKLQLKNNGKLVKFVAKNDENIILRDEYGEPIIQDYVMTTIIYQTRRNKPGNIRVNVSKIAYDLQKIFWFTTIKEICNSSSKLDFSNEFFKEKLNVEIDNGAIVLSPKSSVNIDRLDEVALDSEDAKLLLKIVDLLMKTGWYRIIAEGEKSNKKFNRVVAAGQWKSASEFTGIEQGLKNCIYYLVSEAEEGKPVKMYIGEAKTSGGRLCTRIIDGKTYIGHSEREEDFNVHKFSKYRIDTLCTLEALHDAQDAMIGAFNMTDYLMFPNGFILTNNQLNTAYSRADKERRCK